MKIIFSFLATIFLSVAVVSAQTLTQDINPKVGDTYSNHYLPHVSDPGNTGTGQQWDFSSLIVDSIQTVTVVGPAGAPNGTTDYPNSEEVTKEENEYVFYQSTADSIVSWGYKSATLLGQTKLTNSQKILVYPFQNGNSFQDSLSGSTNITYMSYSIAAIRKGKTVVEADGTGDIKLPGMEYTNVLRVKTTTSIKDSANFMSTPIVVNSTFTTYQWFVDTIRHPVFTINYVNMTHPMYTHKDTLVFMSVSPQPEVTKVEEPVVAIDAVSIYPNPSTDLINVSYDLKKGARVKILLKDSAGKIVEHLSNEQRHSGHNIHTFDISRNKKGTYFVEIDIHGQKTMNKITIQ